MPHFGILDEENMGPRETMLLRAKVHMRSARRRLRQGLLHEGIATLYDAVDSAMSWYAMDPENLSGLDIGPDDDINDAATLCSALARSGVASDPDGFTRLSDAAERLLSDDTETEDVDAAGLLVSAERLFEELGVSPFDESELPPEHPGTR